MQAIRTQYVHPPILEAVIEFQFGETLNSKVLDRVRHHFKGRYPSIEEQRRVEFSMGPTGSFTKESLAGYKMTADAADQVFLCQQNAVASIKLAPYSGWEDFVEIAKKNAQEFWKIVGRKAIKRVGVRYINRIDVADTLIIDGKLDEFLRYLPLIPAGLTDQISSYSYNAVLQFLDLKLKAQINSSTVVPPPLIGMSSFIIDIDVFRDSDIPFNDDELWAIVAEMRSVKNRAFEAGITDRVREIFL